MLIESNRQFTSAAASLAAVIVLLACGPVEPADSASPAADRADRAGPCLEEEPRLLHYARWLATDPDPRIDALRRRYDIEPAPESEVEQVTDPALCMRAGGEYRDALNLPRVPDAVAVIRVGDRYVVTTAVGGPTSREVASAVVLDEDLRVLSTLRR